MWYNFSTLTDGLYYGSQGGCDMQAYCVKCKEKVEIKNEEQVVLKNGRPATKGTCPKCSTKVFTFKTK